MLCPLARSNGGMSSSVAALIAVEMNALISAACAAALVTSSAITTANTRISQLPSHLIQSAPSIDVFQRFSMCHQALYS
jgi:hypothetical protein